MHSPHDLFFNRQHAWSWSTWMTRVVMVYVDELPLLKRLVAHAACVLLCLGVALRGAE